MNLPHGDFFGRLECEKFTSKGRDSVEAYSFHGSASFRTINTSTTATRTWRAISPAFSDRSCCRIYWRVVFNAAIGNADMHLKNWSFIYPDTRTPRLTPGYDFVSTIAYIKDGEMALSVAKEKDTKNLDQPLLERFAVKAGLPKHTVMQTALEAAERTVRVWSEMARDLPLQHQVKEAIDEQLRYVPLTRRFLAGTPGDVSNKPAPKKKNVRSPKSRR